MLVGSSNLTGRSWISTVCLYKNPDSVFKDFKPDVGQDQKAGICHLKFVGADKFVCGFDCG